MTDESQTVENRLLQTNPILESFGNAKTVRNDNSSRFGKYMEIQFGQNSAIIVGATNTDYLLEKIRVVQHDTQERNFHIFYQLIRGCDDKMKKEFDLKSINHFEYLKHGVMDAPGIDDISEFGDINKAFHEMKFDPTNETKAIFEIVLYSNYFLHFFKIFLNFF